jgi:CobQ-like glutamine amidotransferase family enzyme
MAVSEAQGRILRVCALYPDLMNIYADRGNLFVLQCRCAWRGIGFRLSASGLGGQDRDQLLCAKDLLAGKRDALHQAALRGAVVLGVCGGYQLLGESYALGENELEGVGLLDAHTVREPGPRLVGNVAIEVDLGELFTGGAGRRVLAGFENHGGRTYLGPTANPLGRVLKGHGNDGRSGFEGARAAGNVIGTYLHGPLLPKNAWFADWLIATALGVPLDALAPLDDALEDEAHRSARGAAGL